MVSLVPEFDLVERALLETSLDAWRTEMAECGDRTLMCAGTSESLSPNDGKSSSRPIHSDSVSILPQDPWSKTSSKASYI